MHWQFSVAKFNSPAEIMNAKSFAKNVEPSQKCICINSDQALADIIEHYSKLGP